MLIHVICTGNPLHGDDAFGSLVYRNLSEMNLPECVRIFDGGTGGLKILPLMEHADVILIVDAAEKKDDGTDSDLKLILCTDDSGNLIPAFDSFALRSLSTGLHGSGPLSVLAHLKIIQNESMKHPVIYILAGLTDKKITPFSDPSEKIIQAAETAGRWIRNTFQGSNPEEQRLILRLPDNG